MGYGHICVEGQFFCVNKEFLRSGLANENSHVSLVSNEWAKGKSVEDLNFYGHWQEREFNALLGRRHDLIDGLMFEVDFLSGRL